MGIFRLTRFLHGLDSYERHKAVADFIESHHPGFCRILDVGGERRLTTNRLALFLHDKKVDTLNVIAQTDIQVRGVTLPFEDNSYDIVVSIDTIEHIPKQDRQKAVEEYCRIAGKYVVVTGPVGNRLQRESEERLNREYVKLFGSNHHYLIEHLEYGDPTEEEMAELFKGRKIETVFFSDIGVAEKHIGTAFRFCPKIKIINKLFKLFYTAYTIINYKKIEYLKAPLPTTRRFLVFLKND